MISAKGALGSRDGADSDLASAAIFLRVERDLLAFIQAAHASALEGSRVDENVLAAVVRLDEAEALLIVVKLNGTGLHVSSSFV
jgi:hypothetical protein